MPAWGYTRIKKFKLLNVLEFNSTRKRMSVVVKDLDDDRIVLLTKGADSVIEELLDSEKPENRQNLNWTKQHVQLYAQEGLRTLFIAKKELSCSEYESWNAKFQEAATAIRYREARLENINAQIETGLVLIGSTAIEDKLQSDVAQTLQALKLSGIKVWVLTGDKVETAINIGYSAGLLEPSMATLLLDNDTCDMKEELNRIR